MRIARARILRLIGGLALLLSLASCFKDDAFSARAGWGSSTYYRSSLRTDPVSTGLLADRQVMIMVSAGYNSIQRYLKEDLEELMASELPAGNALEEHVLVVLSHLPAGQEPFTSGVPVLYRVYADPSGQVVCDTLQRWGPEDSLCDPDLFHEALDLVQRRFPARNYGMVFSSHATGWLPHRYYFNPSDADPQYSPEGGRSTAARKMRAWRPGSYAFPLIETQEGEPAVKSIGEEDMDSGVKLEMELEDFAAAIPMHLDYLLFDACLCGCVEVADALRGKADLVGFSPTEVLADGLNYKTLTQRLLCAKPDPEDVCRDYFENYAAQSDIFQSATITLVDTRRMEPLESICRELFSRYREPIGQLKGGRVQGYFRFDRHFFYDLKDILVQAGITEQEQEQLDAALDQCIVYKAATPWFYKGGSYGFPIYRYSGFSMYLPSMGSDLLDTHYKEHISWNRATGLVQ